LSRVRVQAIEIEPAQLASWIAAMPTLDEAARMITPSLIPIPATSISAKAVMYCIQIDAASAGDRPGGAGSRIRAGTIACSAQMPYWPWLIIGSTQTRWPAANPSTPGPSASIVPTPS
jgi:hypothetical protein